MRLQEKLLAVLLALFLVSGGGILLLTRRAVSAILIEGAAQRAFLALEERVRTLGSGLQAKDETRLLPALVAALRAMDAAYVMALDDAGLVVAHTNVLEQGKTYRDALTIRALHSEKPGFELAQHGLVLDCALPIWAKDEDFLLSQERGGRTRIGTVRLGLPLAPILASKDRIIARITLILLCSGCLLSLAVMLFLRRVLRPVRLLSESADKIGRGEAGIAIPVLSRDELGDLAQSFNRMSRDLATTTVSKDYLDSVINAIGDPVFVKNEQHRWILVNEALCRMTGLSRPQLIGKTDHDCFPKWQADVFRAGDDRVLANGKEDIAEERISDSEGQVRRISTRKTLYQGQGKRCIVGIITDHGRMGEAVRQSEQRFLQLAEQSGDWIWETDAQGRFTYCSPVVKQILGREPQDILGRFPWDLTAASERELRRRQFQEQQKRPAGLPAVPMRYEHKSGREVVLEVTAGPVLDAQGQLLGLRGVSRDITERRKLEAMLSQAEKMSAVGRLAGGVAHDFNNLLTAIMGFGSFLLENLPPGAQNRDDVEEILKAAGRAAGLTRQLLAFSRRQVLQPQVLDINALLTNTAKMLKRLIGEDVELVLHLAPQVRRVTADPSQMEQVILNLAVNARDAMPQGGRLNVETADADFATERIHENDRLAPGRYVMIAVGDTGTGMSREVLSHIFEPFFTTKEKGKGTGLGLATVHGIVAQSGGSIAVHSEEGRGTCFKIYLPAADESSPAPEVSRGPGEARGGSETIMLVEDDPAALQVALRVLRGKGYQVLPAANPEEAMAASARHDGSVELLVTDMVMPRMDGFALAQGLLTGRPALKILYMSGYTEHAALREGILAARAAFIQKPFTPEDLCRKVREVLDLNGRSGPTGEPPPRADAGL